MSIQLASLSGRDVSVPDPDIQALRRDLHGDLLLPSDADYDQARAIWNAMIDRRPGLIVRCVDQADVVRAVRFAAEHGLLVSIRGGGHNVAGKALCDRGLLVDLSRMNGVTVDPARRRAVVGPGATLADVDKATQAHALAVPVGINSTTGIAGLTLGGGFGWISRKYGLTIDSLLSADVVTANGSVLRCDAQTHPDLFWAVRGGGGNFGIVTSFEFQLHPVGPEVLAGLIVHPFAAARDLMRYYREFCAEAPDDLTVWVVMRAAPPLPFLPPDVHGTPVVVLAVVYAGAVDDGVKALAPLRSFGRPIAEHIGPAPFAGFQQAFDPLLTPGARNYWKSHNFSDISDDLITTVLGGVTTLPSPQSEIFIAQMGGATNRVASDATAYPHRDVEFLMNVHTRWESAADDARCVAWARTFYEDTRRFATGGVYVNFLSDGEEERITGAYRGNLTRLASVKARYDPTNLFRLNQNIAPQDA